MDKLFPTAGLPFQLLESIAYDPRAQDLSVEVTKIRALNPDLVLVVTRAADAIKLVRDMVRQRFEPMGIISPGSPGLYDEEFYQALGPLADYPIYNIPWANPKAADGAGAGSGLQAGQSEIPLRGRMLQCRLHVRGAADRGRRLQARRHDANGAELMKAIRATDIAEHVMIGPPIKFDDKGQNIAIPSAVVQNRNRTPTVVLPAESRP